MSTLSFDERARWLRVRADRLRALASRLERASVHQLLEQSGEVTWSGPRPDACRSALGAHLRRLTAGIGDLRHHATQLDDLADDVDRQAALYPSAGGGR